MRIEELSRGGFYERRLSLQSCFGSRDSDHVLRCLSDSSMILRGLAIRLVALICDNDQALNAFSMVTTRSARKKLIQRMSKRRRFDVADEYLRRMMAEQNQDLSSGQPAIERGISDDGLETRFECHPDQ